MGEVNPQAFGELPPRPVKPTQALSNAATDRQARQHYSMMLDYWISEARWQELRADKLNAELSAFLKRTADETTAGTVDEPLVRPCSCRDGARYRFIRQGEDMLPTEHEDAFSQMWEAISLKGNWRERMDRIVDAAMARIAEKTS